ncbi:MAG: isocitrate lyase/phosphoenolpyruvate mutase family protein [Deltaproteobacteria bacterium]|nr:isocitrate lyase/phosphoenolpyruvate mutase family protein [Deltaproteobacteria bacterium]
MEPPSAERVAAANERSLKLKELIRAPEILIMPGAYDVLSALLFERLGFSAIQCTSGGIAAVLGYDDGEVMSRELTVNVTGQIAQAVSVPVNADGERGYGDAVTVGETARALIAVGSAGMNLEDGAPHQKKQPRCLVELAEQLQKIRAIIATKRALGSEFFLNARVDALAVMTEEPKKALDEAIRRGNAYAEAGADCIFYMNAVARDTIGRLVKEVQAPVSVLARPETPGVAELQDLGVARVSYGAAFTRAAISAVKRLALEIQESGTITALNETMSSAEMMALVKAKRVRNFIS